MVMDIDATRLGREPDFGLIEKMAAECRMPLCYGGGVSSVSQYQKLVALGVEKVAVGAAAISQPDLIRQAAEAVGVQSVAVVLDVKRGSSQKNYTVFTHNGSRDSGLDAEACAMRYAGLGAGEIIINCIERDGTMAGYDTEVLAKVRSAVSVPLTILGGARALVDMAEVAKRFDSVGVAAGSLFVFKGTYKAVLINYPSRHDKDRLFSR
jgi:cyclase